MITFIAQSIFYIYVKSDLPVNGVVMCGRVGDGLLCAKLLSTHLMRNLSMIYMIIVWF